MLICFGSEYFISYKNLTREKFIQASSVAENSWAEALMHRIYDCLLGNAVNVIEEYERFYAVEYSTFEEFLVKRYGITDKELDAIKKNLPKDYILVYGCMDSQGDYNTSQLMEFSDEIVESVNEILTKGEKL